jgi:uncharacterized protein YoxC
MVCQNCAATVPEGQIFCGNCGNRLTDTVSSVSQRLTKVELQIAGPQDKVLQHNLEIETVEKIMSRVQKWTTLILYFAGIPAAVAFLALAVMFGKGAFDLHKIAANAKESVNTLLGEARSEASEAEKTARDAVATSKEVDAGIQGTETQVSKLKSEVDGRSAEVRNLGGQVDSLAKTISAQSQQFQHLTEQVRAVQTTKNVADIQTVYPIFGEHMARTLTDWINPKQKTPGMIYVDIILYLPATPNISDVKVAEGITALNDHKYTVMVGGVSVYARTATSFQQVGAGFGGNSCMLWVLPETESPCIIYFRDTLRNSAMEIRNLLKVAQVVPDSQVFYVDPKQLDSQKVELLELSAIDIVVVLGRNDASIR